MAAGKKTKTSTESVLIQKTNMQIIQLGIVGDSSLICHNWSERAKKAMLDKQMKKSSATAPKTAKNPALDYEESLYRFSDSGFGFPAAAFKEAAVSACRQHDLPMTQAKGLFHVLGDLVPIFGSAHMREDMVRLETGVADIRFRGEFSQWATMLTVRYNADVISKEQLISLFTTGGFAVGVGEWRPGSPKGKTGNHGMFHVATAEENKAIIQLWEQRFPKDQELVQPVAVRGVVPQFLGVASDMAPAPAEYTLPRIPQPEAAEEEFPEVVEEAAGANNGKVQPEKV